MVLTRDRLADLTARMAQTKSTSYPLAHRQGNRIYRELDEVGDAGHSDTSRLNADDEEIDYLNCYDEDWHNDDEEEITSTRSRLMSESAAWLVVEKFLHISAQMHQEIHLLESYVEDVKLKHSQILVSPHEDKKTKDELDSVMEAFNQLSRKVRKTVKEMERGFQKSKTQRSSGGNQKNGVGTYCSRAGDRIQENQLTALNRRLLKVLRAYNEEQVRYRDCCAKRIKSYIDLTGIPIDEDELDEIIESGNLYKRMGGIFVDEGKTKMMLEDIEARHADIIRLEASVRELHQMFHDMALLVEEQGEKIDNIEFNVQLAVEYTERAKRQIKTAVAHRDRYRRKKFLLCGICGVLLIIIAVILTTAVCSHGNCSRRATSGIGREEILGTNTTAYAGDI